MQRWTDSEGSYPDPLVWFECPECHKALPDWTAYQEHRCDEEQPNG